MLLVVVVVVVAVVLVANDDGVEVLDAEVTEHRGDAPAELSEDAV